MDVILNRGNDEFWNGQLSQYTHTNAIAEESL